ncbi:hypothetical protein SESBI_07776 [Sesbania bispinosa]|nr:hypothetical protein SESBI_07776 [Sesbania bispinosa]
METILTTTTIDPTISGEASPVFFHLLRWRQQHLSDYASGIAKGWLRKLDLLRTRFARRIPVASTLISSPPSTLIFCVNDGIAVL